MFNWFYRKISIARTPKILEETPGVLTRDERLQAVLISYKTGKISLEKAKDLIYVWRLSSK